MIQHTCEIQVRYAETDQMQFAHHSNYIIWFEYGRIQLLKNLGISYKELEESGYLMPVLEVHAKFIKYAVFDEILQLKTLMREFPSAKQKFEYEIYNQHQELICNGSSLHSFINKGKKAVKPPKELREKLRPFFK